MANLSVHRSARIKQQQQQQGHNSLVASELILVEGELDSELDADPELWCSCQGYDDGRLMICCDQKGEDCCVWYHYDCLGLPSTKIGELKLLVKTMFASPVSYRTIESIHHLLWIPPVCLIHLLILIGEKLVDRHFVTSYYLHNYEEVVHLRSNIFLVPFGKAGRSFVSELTRLYQAFVDDSALRSIAMMACSVMQPLLLQKPSQRSRARDHSSHLIRRLIYGRRGYLMN